LTPWIAVRKEYVDYIKWAIEFAQDNLDSYTPGKWKDLMESFLPCFLKFAPSIYQMEASELEAGAAKTKPPEFRVEVIRFAELTRRTGAMLAGDKEAYTEGEVREAQAILLDALSGLLPGSKYSVEENGTYGVHIFKSDESFSLVPQFDVFKPRLVTALGRILAESRIAPNQLRRCPRCDRIFYLSRKPRLDRKLFFCNVRCQLYYHRDMRKKAPMSPTQRVNG